MISYIYVVARQKDLKVSVKEISDGALEITAARLGEKALHNTTVRKKPVPNDLIAAACKVRQQAYSRYSGFQVGAALRTAVGAIVTGCNVENASYGLTICAERSAVFSAIALGQQEFMELAIATPGGAMPCGACRQVLAEFAPELTIWLVNADQPEQVVETNLRDLLPGRFELQQ